MAKPGDRKQATSLAPTIGELTPADAALSLVTAIASAVPVIGGPAASAVAEVRRAFDRRQAARLAAIVNDLGGELRRLDDRIKRDFGDDGEFADFLEAAMQSAAEARNVDKRRYYVTLMARAATTEGPDAAQRALLLGTLDRVGLTHLRVLHAVASGPRVDRPREYHIEGTPAFDALRTAMPDLDMVFVHRAWEDLVALGVLDSWTDYIVADGSPVSAQNQGAITGFGQAFLRFVTPFPPPDHEAESE